MNLSSDGLGTPPRHDVAYWRTWPDDWPVLVKTRANLLVTGPGPMLDQFLATAQTMLRAPIYAIAGGAPFGLQSASTLIVHDVDKLDRTAQRLLLEWVNDPRHADVQIISTSTVSVFPLVQQNGFDPDLYYRLAVIWLQAEELGRKSPSAPAGN